MPRPTFSKERVRQWERDRVDAAMRAANLQRMAARQKSAAAAPPPTPEEVRNMEAEKRRNAIIQQVAPSGFQRLLQALGL